MCSFVVLAPHPPIAHSLFIYFLFFFTDEYKKGVEKVKYINGEEERLNTCNQDSTVRTARIVYFLFIQFFYEPSKS